MRLALPLCGSLNVMWSNPRLAFHVGTPANHSDLGDSGGIDPAFLPFRFLDTALTIIDICT